MVISNFLKMKKILLFCSILTLLAPACDVLDVEPPPANHPLLAADIPHLLLTPHVAWASDNAQARLAQRLIDMVLDKSLADQRPGSLS